MRYRAFLSYSHEDKKWARWLHRKLESYRLPRNLAAADGNELPKRLAPIFRDRDELPSTASLSDAVNDALSESEWLIVICSPDAAASRWVNEEIRTFRRLSRPDQILCFMVGGEPFTSDETECFPPALIEADTAGGKSIEPVAADARPHGDGKTNALLKVVAGMLGIGFDVLKHRDQTKRNQRMVAATAGSLLIAVVTIALAVSATIARNEADLRREQAEDLIDFMLGDLQDQLREIGRLDLYRSIGDKAMEYFAQLDDENVSDFSLAQRAKNLRQIGEVRLEQGHLSEALISFEESQSMMIRLAEKGAGNTEYQIGLANSYFYVGAVYWQRGQLSEARRQFELIIPIVDALSTNEPDNTKWLVERGYGYTNLGRVLELEGALDEALKSYETVMQINQRLIDLESDNPEWILELGYAHNNIGKLLVSYGRLSEAEHHYRRDLALKKEVQTSNPQHNLWLAYVAVSEYFLGDLLVSTGNYDEAQGQLGSAHQKFTRLIQTDPDRINWKARLANIERALCRMYLNTNRRGRAIELLNTSIDRLTAVSNEEPGDAGYRRALARGLIQLANAELATREFASAENHLDAAYSHIKTLLQQEPTSRDTQHLAIFADVCAARIAELQDPEFARSSYSRVLERVEKIFPSGSDPRVLALAANALAGLGRHDEAGEIERKLLQMGYIANDLF